jgi:tetratricopeptide (TPR) repeat protein
MGLSQAEREIAGPGVPERLRADLEATKGNILTALGRQNEAVESYGRALERYEALSIPFEACRTRINMTSALIELGETTRARILLRQTLAEAEAGGYERQSALALSNLALLHFSTGDLSAAETYCIRSNTIARPREFLSVVFRNCYYLWKVALELGDQAAATAHEKTLKTYVSRIEESFTELELYRAYLTGGKS